MPRETVFTVTTIARGGVRYGGDRCVAICLSEERAKEIIETNEGDIFETSYTWAVIERVSPDTLYGGLEHCEDSRWYEWHGDYSTGGYVLLSEPPAKFRNVVGFWEVGPVWHQLVEKKFTDANPRIA